MGRVILKISVGFVIGGLIVLTVSLYLSNYLVEQAKLARARNIEGAMAEVKWAMRLNPFGPDPPAAEADLLSRRGRAEAAAEAYREAIRRAPANYETYMDLGDLQRLQLDDPEAAAESYREALRYHNPNAVDPVVVDAVSGLADALWRTGDLEGAKAQYEWLQEHGPFLSVRELYTLGKIQIRLGEPEKALRNFYEARYKASVGLESLDDPQEKGSQDAEREAFVESLDLAIADARKGGGAR